MYKVIAIVGPTGVGKSDVSIKLAHDFNCEIINGDSIQFYQGLDIGSAKITEEEKEGVKHYLLDVVSIGQDYNVYTFQKQARAIIGDLNKKGIIPIVVGGTGLYIKALLYDYQFTQNNNQETYQEYTNEELYEKLKETDYKSAEKIHVNNRKRIVRALQICQNGTLKSQQEEAQQHKLVYDAFVIGLTMNRDLLKERIDKRVDSMMKKGLLEEVTKVAKNHSFSEAGLQGIGYKEFEQYFIGNQTLEETIELIKTHTRQFVKRQYTWFKNQMDVNWYDVLETNYYDNIKRDVKEWLTINSQEQ